MDSFKQAIFLKELFKLKNQQSGNKDWDSASQFGEDFIRGLSKDNPYVDKEKLSKLQSSKSEEEMIDMLKESNIDIISMIDDIFKNLSETEISHGGHSIDASVISDFWNNMKSKYKAHSDFEDINNI
tara:strand:- start:488 stop:868 length:381 start_codon:yes stop_codon:yes gene_type:complete